MATIVEVDPESTELMDQEQEMLELMDTVDKYFPLVCILSPSHR